MFHLLTNLIEKKIISCKFQIIETGKEYAIALSLVVSKMTNRPPARSPARMNSFRRAFGQGASSYSTPRPLSQSSIYSSFILHKSSIPIRNSILLFSIQFFPKKMPEPELNLFT